MVQTLWCGGRWCACTVVLGPYDAREAALAEEAGLPSDVQLGARCCMCSVKWKLKSARAPWGGISE
jgi:hypothetical protein